MLTYEFTEQELIRQRGLQASTFVSQPFWIELIAGLRAIVQEKQKALEESRFANPQIKAAMVDHLIIAKELVARIERIPQAAIEAARELGEG